jgi:uncharacterized membrane protein
MTDEAPNKEHEMASNSTEPLDDENQGIEGVLERVAEKDPEAAEKISHFIAVQQVTHRGPMPAPEDLEAYSKTLADLPDRMMKMAELAQTTKATQNQKILELKERELEVQKLETEHADKAHEREIQNQSKGMSFAFVTVMVCVLGAFYLAINDKTEVALVIGGTTVVGVVGAFLRNTFARKK